MQRLDPDDPRHGANGYGRYGCRCDICRQGNAERHRIYMEAHPEQRAKQKAYRKRHYAETGR